MSYVVGIDLGTTSTVAAVCRPGGAAQVVPLEGAAGAVPSAVYLGADGTFLVGEAAQRRALSDPGHVVRDLTRRVGDATPVLVGRAARWRPRSSPPGSSRGWWTTWPGARAAWPRAWRSRTRQAGGRTGLGALHAALAEQGLGSAMLVPEPVAAATGYAAGARVEPGATVGIYDLGGGRCDATVLRRGRDGFAVVGAPEGVEQFGGADLDEVVLAHVRDALGPAWEALDPTDPEVLAAVADLRREATAAKEALSHDTEVLVPVALPGVAHAGAARARGVRGDDPPGRWPRPSRRVRRALDGAGTSARRPGGAGAGGRLVADPARAAAAVGGVRARRDGGARPASGVVAIGRGAGGRRAGGAGSGPGVAPVAADGPAAGALPAAVSGAGAGTDRRRRPARRPRPGVAERPGAPRRQRRRPLGRASGRARSGRAPCRSRPAGRPARPDGTEVLAGGPAAEAGAPVRWRPRDVASAPDRARRRRPVRSPWRCSAGWWRSASGGSARGREAGRGDAGSRSTPRRPRRRSLVVPAETPAPKAAPPPPPPHAPGHARRGATTSAPPPTTTAPPTTTKATDDADRDRPAATTTGPENGGGAAPGTTTREQATGAAARGRATGTGGADNAAAGAEGGADGRRRRRGGRRRARPRPPWSGRTGRLIAAPARPLLVARGGRAGSAIDHRGRARTAITASRTSGPFVLTYRASGPSSDRGPGPDMEPALLRPGWSRTQEGRGSEGTGAGRTTAVSRRAAPGARPRSAGPGTRWPGVAGRAPAMRPACARRRAASWSQQQRPSTNRSGWELPSSSAVPPATARRIARSRWVRFAVIGPAPFRLGAHGAHRRQRGRGQQEPVTAQALHLDVLHRPVRARQRRSGPRPRRARHTRGHTTRSSLVAAVVGHVVHLLRRIVGRRGALVAVVVAARMCKKEGRIDSLMHAVPRA